MPTITATPIDSIGTVQVDVDWSDFTSLTGPSVKVERVNSLTGAAQPLRPHTYIDAELGQYIHLSNGKARLYDTEAPLDVPVFYRMALGDDPDGVAVQSGVRDTFSRVAANTWSPAESGQAYSLTGTAADFDITGALGNMALTAVNSERVATLATVSMTDVDMTARLSIDKLAVTQPINVYLRARVTGTTFYQLRVAFNPANQIQLQWERVVAGVTTALGTLTTQLDDTAGGAPLPFVAAGSYYIRAQVIGSRLRAKVWESGFPNAGWTVDLFDATITAPGGVALRGLLTTGNTTVLPVLVSWGEFAVGNAAVAAASTVTLDNPDGFWLRNPLVPCDDRLLVLCPDPACPPAAGTIFVSMDSQQRPANSSAVGPVNRSLPVAVSRPRRGIRSTLNLVTVTFDDRDALDQLCADGRPLLFQAPAAWRMPDRYMDVGDTDEARAFADHRNPYRAHSLPYNQVERPAGPAKGACGVRYMDFCDNLATDTWAETLAAGTTYNDMIDLVP